MLSGDVKSVLKAMPAATIKKFEVITDPGAKYDAEGTGGILNIITTGKQRLEGYMANLSANAGKDYYGASFYGRTKLRNVTASANFNFNQPIDRGVVEPPADGVRHGRRLAEMEPQPRLPLRRLIYVARRQHFLSAHFRPSGPPHHPLLHLQLQFRPRRRTGPHLRHGRHLRGVSPPAHAAAPSSSTMPTPSRRSISSRPASRATGSATTRTPSPTTAPLTSTCTRATASR
mgnify:CR=1 FL=1